MDDERHIDARWPRRVAWSGLVTLAAAALTVAFIGIATAQETVREYEPPPRDVVAEFLGQGEAAFRRGDYAAATEAWREAARMCRTTGLVAGEGDALARSAEANLALGFTQVAIAELQLALQRADEAKDARLIAAVSGALGNALLLARQYPQAEPNIERSVAAARALGEFRILAASGNNQGNLYAATDRQSEALQAYQDSATAAAAAGDHQVLMVAKRNAARLLARRGEDEAAVKAAGEAADAARKIPASHGKTLGLVSIGSLLTRVDGKGRAGALAYAALRDAATDAEATKDTRGQSLAYGYLGHLYETLGRVGEAMLLTERAVDLAQREKLPELTYRWDWQLGRLLQAGGSETAALDAYLRAVRELQEIRRDVPIDYEEGRSSFRETIGPLFLQVADLLMRKAAKGESSAAVAGYLAQARETVERIKQAEIQDFFKDQCVGLTTGKSVKVETVSPNTAVLYPIILPDRMEILVSLGDKDTFVTTPVTEIDLTEQAALLRSALEDPQSPIELHRQPAQRIHEWLIRPIEAILAAANVRTLVIVPDGALRTIPLAALFDGKKYLVESYAIATAPGLTLVDPSPLPRQGMAALVVGVSDGVQGFPPIPDVKAEVETIGQRLSATTMLNQAFQVATFEQQLTVKPYKIVHIASHGVFGGTAEDSYVLAYDAKIDMNKLEEMFKLKRVQPEAVELLTLSACNTAAGDDRAPLGLAGVALKSGARSSIASLWSVSDAATAELIADVYARLQDAKVTKAEALRLAQTHMLEGGRFAHPVYWAPFLLIGNWL